MPTRRLGLSVLNTSISYAAKFVVIGSFALGCGTSAAQETLPHTCGRPNPLLETSLHARASWVAKYNVRMMQFFRSPPRGAPDPVGGKFNPYVYFKENWIDYCDVEHHVLKGNFEYVYSATQFAQAASILRQRDADAATILQSKSSWFLWAQAIGSWLIAAAVIGGIAALLRKCFIVGIVSKI